MPTVKGKKYPYTAAGKKAAKKAASGAKRAPKKAKAKAKPVKMAAGGLVNPKPKSGMAKRAMPMGTKPMKAETRSMPSARPMRPARTKPMKAMKAMKAIMPKGTKPSKRGR